MSASKGELGIYFTPQNLKFTPQCESAIGILLPCCDDFLFDLILYVPSTIFQLNRDGSSWVKTSTKLGLMCHAQGPQRSEAGTRGLLVSSQALYHWATDFPVLWWNISHCSKSWPLKPQSQLQQTASFYHLSQFSKKITYDISWESSASRRFSWNIPYLLFLKKQHNLKLSSAANYRWRFKG